MGPGPKRRRGSQYAKKLPSAQGSGRTARVSTKANPKTREPVWGRGGGEGGARWPFEPHIARLTESSVANGW